MQASDNRLADAIMSYFHDLFPDNVWIGQFANKRTTYASVVGESKTSQKTGIRIAPTRAHLDLYAHKLIVSEFSTPQVNTEYDIRDPQALPIITAHIKRIIELWEPSPSTTLSSDTFVNYSPTTPQSAPT